MALKVDRWNEEKEGKITKDAIIKKLEREGYRPGFVVFPPGLSFAKHAHKQDFRATVTFGRYFVRSGEEEVVISRGEIVYIPKDESHTEGVSGFMPCGFIAGFKD